MTGVSHLKKPKQKLKKCKDYNFCGESTADIFWDSQDILFIDFLTEKRTVNTVYYLKILEDQVKTDFVQNNKVNQ
jgi:hypothetical protein